MKVSFDNLIYYVEDATTYQHDEFRRQLEIAETYGRISQVRHSIGNGFSKYHYNTFIGVGAGAIHIGYKHNSSPEGQNSYRMRVEVNPSKKLAKDAERAQRMAMSIIAECFSKNTKYVRGVEVAFDIPIPRERLCVVSKTGRERNMYKGTVYYGERGQHGYLKMYDKKKELKQKQGKEIAEEHLTRIEISLRFETNEFPLTFHLFSKISSMNFNDLYQVSELKIQESVGNVKACIIAVTSGEMQIGELSRAAQVKMKKALADMGLLDLDLAYANASRKSSKLLLDFVSNNNPSISEKTV